MDTLFEGQLVTFFVGHETYGIDIARVREVIHYQEVTVLPNMPRQMEGVIELRGRVIPVVSLKRRLGVEETREGRPRIVILDVAGRNFGAVVDDISNVLQATPEQCETAPDAVVDDEAADCVYCLVKQGKHLVIVIDPERILSRKELGRMLELCEDAGDGSGEDVGGDVA